MSGIATWQMAVRDALADGQCHCVDDIVRKTGLSHHVVRTMAGKLIIRGLVERVERGCFRLTEAGIDSVRQGEVLRSGPHRKHTGRRRQPRDTFRQRAWSAMRMLHRFSVPELMRLASRPGEKGGTADGLHRYLRALELAGYVRRLRSREPGTRPGSNGFVRWLLVRDTGPVAPALRVRERQLIDRNTGKVIDLGEARHDEAA